MEWSFTSGRINLLIDLVHFLQNFYTSGNSRRSGEGVGGKNSVCPSFKVFWVREHRRRKEMWPLVFPLPPVPCVPARGINVFEHQLPLLQDEGSACGIWSPRKVTIMSATTATATAAVSIYARHSARIWSALFYLLLTVARPSVLRRRNWSTEKIRDCLQSQS